MTTIGMFQKTPDGSFHGAIRTLALSLKAVDIRPIERAITARAIASTPGPPNSARHGLSPGPTSLMAFRSASTIRASPPPSTRCSLRPRTATSFGGHAAARLDHSGTPRPRGVPSASRFEKFPRLHIKRSRDPLDHVDGRRIDAALQRTDICPVDICAIREFFLRQALPAPSGAQVRRKYLPGTHCAQSASASRIPPRSILYTRGVDLLRLDPKKLRRIDFKRSRNLLDDIDRYGCLRRLKLAQPSPIHAGEVRKLLLRQVERFAPPEHVPREDPPELHRPETMGL